MFPEGLGDRDLCQEHAPVILNNWGMKPPPSEVKLEGLTTEVAAMAALCIHWTGPLGALHEINFLTGKAVTLHAAVGLIPSV